MNSNSNSDKERSTNLDSKSEKYNRMGGLLLLIVIVSIAYSLLMVSSVGLVFLSQFMLNRLGHTIYFPFIYYALLFFIFLASALRITSAIQLIKRKSAFLRSDQLMWLANFTSYVLLSVIAGMRGYADYTHEDLLRIIGNIAVSLIGLFFLTLYFSKSVRVRTYMGNEEYKERAIFKFDDSSPYHKR